MHSPWFLPFVALLLLYVVTSVVSFATGQRLLNELRERFPAHYVAEGEPTYLSFAVLGKGYWRPVSASNFFRLRRYLTLDDEDYSARAAHVRAWQMTARYSSWLMVVLMLYIAYFAS